MARPVLVLVQGIPGSGKTTLARKLAADLQLPQIGKDDIKELLFDHLGLGDREWSRILGKATADMLFVLIDSLAAAGRSFMVESAFFYEFAAPRIGAMIQTHGYDSLEIYCTTDHDVRRERFRRRYESGKRHPGHADKVQDERTDEELTALYAPLSLGACITVDTTLFGDAQYRQLVADVRTALQQDSKGGKL